MDPEEIKGAVDELTTAVETRFSEYDSGLKRFKKDLEGEFAAQKERIETLEAISDRPRANTEHSYSRDDNEHKGVFIDWVRHPADDRCKSRLAEAQHELSKKDVSIGSLPGGGYGLPKEISSQIEHRVRQLNPFRGLVDVVQCSSNDFNYLVSLGDGTSGWSSETGTRSATNAPNLRNIAPTFGELYALPTATNWSLEDLFFDVQQWLVDDISADWAAAEATAIISGDGSNKPTGVLAINPVSTADTASPMRAAGVIQYVPLTSPTSPVSLTIDSLITLVHTVAERYTMERDRVAFVMHRLSVAALRRLKASTAGSYMWTEAQEGTPATLLGFPVFTCDGMPVIANDAFSVLFGNWRRAYLLADRSGMAITLDPYSTPGKTRFYARRRVGGRIKNNDALKALRISDT